jgi:hypothetical protein
MYRSLLFAIAVVGCTGTRHLDPPPQPAALVPPVAVPPTPPTDSRVILDVVDGPSDVQIKVINPSGALWAPVCTTPCALDLPAGPHELSFVLRGDSEHNDAATVNVPHGASLYRRQLAYRTESPGMTIGGYFIGYTGLVVLLTGLAIAAANEAGGRYGNSNVGLDVALVGGAMTLGGGLMFYYGQPAQREAAVTHVSLTQ